MINLNYHHLRLFWAVAREGSVARASERLHLTPQTISMQVRDFENAIGEALFHRSRRQMILTETGRMTLQYADEIFAIGDELRNALAVHSSRRPQRLVIGVADVVPKIIAHRLIEPALHLEVPVRILCREGSPERLLAALAIHELDLVLSDGPIPSTVSIHGFNHKLGTCGVTLLARPDLAARLRRGFPQTLDGAPALMPTDENVLRRQLEDWFAHHGVTPTIVGEFDDSALLGAFGHEGTGFFSVPAVIADEVIRQYEVEAIGDVSGVTEDYYAISLERRVRHPAVAAICDSARSELFRMQRSGPDQEASIARNHAHE